MSNLSNLSLTEELRSRLLLHDFTDEATLNSLPPGTPFYLGVDPTAPYLHVGNLIPMLIMIRLAKRGLKPIMLFGGSTGSIGDPSGRSTERPLLSRENIDANIDSQSQKVREIFNRQEINVTFVNNHDWTKSVTLIDFLRDVGKFITVNYMLGKEVVKTRLEGEGISYTEFSYMLLQAFDFWHLYTTCQCRLQIGGSDQWGNITAGLELIRKKGGEGAVALSAPLILDGEGKKFGKSAGNAIWLDERGFSPYRLHQYLLNVADNDVERYLKIFTFLSLAEISDIIVAHNEAPHQRAAQRALADNLVKIIHGAEAVQKANTSAQVLFGGSFESLKASDLLEIFEEVPSTSLPLNEIIGTPVLNLLVTTGAVPSKGEGRRMIEQGGIYIGNIRINTIEETVRELHIVDNQILIIRVGKKKYTIVRCQH
jgi:tyrosyl-tRNA synthetase